MNVKAHIKASPTSQDPYNYISGVIRSTEIKTDQDLNIKINREVIGGSESKN